MWENDKAGQPTDGNMAQAYWMLVPKATDTHAEYVIFIELPLQVWLHERAPLFCCAYIA